MDRKHVFADKLELVTGFVFYKNGVIAATAPDIWYLEDTNGDEVADKRTKLYTGLGIADTHAVINNLRWGLDGWIYATHGYSVGTVTSARTARRTSAATAAASSASSRMAARSSSTAAAAATPGASTSPGTARCSGRSRRAAPCSSTPCCRKRCSPRASCRTRPRAKGMITGQTTYPRDVVAGAGLRADRSGRPVHRRGGLRRSTTAARGPTKWRYSYFTGEPTLNIVHHAVRAARRRQLHDARRKPGREETEFIRSTRSLVPADRDARRSRRRALRHRLLQPGGDPQRHARAAARPGERRRASRSRPLLRPHLARPAQAGEDARGAGAEPARPAGPAARDGDQPERPRQGDRVAARARELRLRSARREAVEADGQQGAGAVREVPRRDDGGRGAS